MMLATYWPIFTLTLLGDAPEAAALPAQATFDPVAMVSGLSPLQQFLATLAFGFVVSVIVSFWSDYVRRLGPKAAPWMLSLSAALNVAAGNPHKAARAQKAAKRGPPLNLTAMTFIPKHAADCKDSNCDCSCMRAETAKARPAKDEPS